jgi:hypothetical protein
VCVRACMRACVLWLQDGSEQRYCDPERLHNTLQGTSNGPWQAFENQGGVDESAVAGFYSATAPVPVLCRLLCGLFAGCHERWEC